MLKTSIILYSNLQYAEISQKQIPELIQKSYLPVLKGLLKRPKTKVLFGITGRSLEIIKKDYKEVLEILQELIKQEKIEICGGTFSNAVLPLLPEERRLVQIEEQLKLIKKYLIRSRPNGFLLPEFAWEPTLSDTLDRFGFKWVIIPKHLIDFSHQFNISAPLKSSRREYSGEIGAKILDRSLLRKIYNLPKISRLFHHELKVTNHKPFIIEGINEKIIGIPSLRTWTAFVILAMANKALQNKAKLENLLEYQAKNGQGIFAPFMADIENIGFRGNNPIYFEVGKFFEFFDILTGTRGIKIGYPREFLPDFKNKEKIYLKTGSAAPMADLGIWLKDPDNANLEFLCSQVREKMARKKVGSFRYKKASRFLMLAENGDARGWNPLPERRLDALKAAKNALKILEK